MEYSIININFDFRIDSQDRDIDSANSTLRQYHKILWSKILPNGKFFNLSDKEEQEFHKSKKDGIYLHHKSELGGFFLGSDAITHTYKNHKRKQWIIQQIPNEVDELYATGFTIGAYIIFPNNKINGENTINQERGCNKLIDDRFDLTLECIRRYYLGQEKPNPLYETLKRYKNFFDLFGDFNN
jgi:hypothetical protein